MALSGSLARRILDASACKKRVEEEDRLTCWIKRAMNFVEKSARKVGPNEADQVLLY